MCPGMLLCPGHVCQAQEVAARGALLSTFTLWAEHAPMGLPAHPGGPDLRVWWSSAFAPSPFRKRPPPQVASLPARRLLGEGMVLTLPMCGVSAPEPGEPHPCPPYPPARGSSQKAQVRGRQNPMSVCPEAAWAAWALDVEEGLRDLPLERSPVHLPLI